MMAGAHMLSAMLSPRRRARPEGDSLTVAIFTTWSARSASMNPGKMYALQQGNVGINIEKCWCPDIGALASAPRENMCAGRARGGGTCGHRNEIKKCSDSVRAVCTRHGADAVGRTD